MYQIFDFKLVQKLLNLSLNKYTEEIIVINHQIPLNYAYYVNSLCCDQLINECENHRRMSDTKIRKSCETVFAQSSE